ncbi:MAG: alpha/beta hydrolase [Nanoarchaeota archaeon]
MYLRSFDGTRIFYKLSMKQGPTLVFLHGWGLNWTAWKEEISYFSKEGYSTLAIDLRGHGLSGKPMKAERYHMNWFTHDVKEVVKKHGLKDIILVGHSMGGMIALNYYALFPKDVAAMALISSTYKSVLDEGSAKRLNPFLRHLFDYLERRERPQPRTRSDVDLSRIRSRSDYRIFLESVRAMPMRSVIACLEGMTLFNMKALLRRIKVPVLVLYGEGDRVRSLEESRFMKRRIPHAEITVIKRAGHNITITSPAALNRRMLDFLKRNGCYGQLA